MTTALAVRNEQQIVQLDDIVKQANLQVVAAYGQFKQALVMANAVRQIEKQIDDEMMQDIMALQNTSLGFRTDKSGRGYDVDTVRQCFIEAVLRGVRIVGNEFNIISGRPYITKEGFSRLVREYPGLTDLRLMPGVPEMKSGGALVTYRATWKLRGNPAELNRTKAGEDDSRIPVRVNAGMGADAIIGKATRKMLAAIYGVLTGANEAVPEGEVDDLGAVGNGGARRSELTDELPEFDGSDGEQERDDDPMAPSDEVLRRDGLLL